MVPRRIVAHSRQLPVGILGSCASMRNVPDLRIPGTFLTMIISRGVLPLSPFIS
jgi:hypothetical protein